MAVAVTHSGKGMGVAVEGNHDHSRGGEQCKQTRDHAQQDEGRLSQPAGPGHTEGTKHAHTRVREGGNGGCWQLCLQEAAVIILMDMNGIPGWRRQGGRAVRHNKTPRQ